MGGAAVGRSAKSSRSRRSLELRASPSVGSRWQPGVGSQTVSNKSNRCAGARGGAGVDKPRWLRILTITGGSSMAAMIFKAPPQFGSSLQERGGQLVDWFGGRDSREGRPVISLMSYNRESLRLSDDQGKSWSRSEIPLNAKRSAAMPNRVSSNLILPRCSVMTQRIWRKWKGTFAMLKNCARICVSRASAPSSRRERYSTSSRKRSCKSWHRHCARRAKVLILLPQNDNRFTCGFVLAVRRYRFRSTFAGDYCSSH